MKISLALAFTASALAAPALAEAPPPGTPAVAAQTDAGLDPVALATAREIIRTGFPEDKRPALFNGVIDALTNQIRNVTMTKLNNDPKAKAIVDARLDKFISSGKAVLLQHIPAFMDAYAQAYAREFSQSELDEILKFAKTDAGGHFLLRGGAVVSDPAFVAVNEAYMRQLQPMIETMQADLIAELVEYFESNPPKPSSSS